MFLFSLSYAMFETYFSEICSRFPPSVLFMKILHKMVEISLTDFIMGNIVPSLSLKETLASLETMPQLIFALLLIVAAVISKIIGCGLGGKICGLGSHQSLVVGIGMVARSEVALMVAQKGINAGMIDPVILPAIVLSVIASALVTPILLKLSISKGPELL